MIGVGSDIGVDKGAGRGGGKGDRRGDLLDWLDLVLQRRGVGRPAGERGAVGRSRVDRVQLQFLVSIRRDLKEVRCCSCCFVVVAPALTIPHDRVDCFDRVATTNKQQEDHERVTGRGTVTERAANLNIHLHRSEGWGRTPSHHRDQRSDRLRIWPGKPSPLGLPQVPACS